MLSGAAAAAESRRRSSSGGSREPPPQRGDPDDLEWECSTLGCGRPRAVWFGGDGSCGKYACCCRTCEKTNGTEHGRYCGCNVEDHHRWAELVEPHPSRCSYQCWGGPEAYITPNGAWSSKRKRRECEEEERAKPSAERSSSSAKPSAETRSPAQSAKGEAQRRDAQEAERSSSSSSG